MYDICFDLEYWPYALAVAWCVLGGLLIFVLNKIYNPKEKLSVMGGIIFLLIWPFVLVLVGILSFADSINRWIEK